MPDDPRHSPARSSRRGFLRRAILVPSLLAAWPVLPGRSAPAPPRRAGGSFLKPALNVFSFLELFRARERDPAQGVDLFDVCDFCAKQDLDAVDVTGYFFPGYPQVPEDGYVFALKRHAFDRGLAVSGTGVRNDFTAADASVRAEGVQRVKAWIPVAARLGAPVIRVFADSQAPFKSWQEAARGAGRDEVEAWMARAIRECAEEGARHGVVVGVQNHGDFLVSGDEHLRLLERVNHPWCAPIVDTGKYLTPDPYADVARVAPYACNWQVKETLYSRADAPRTDLVRLVKIIRASGYRGYLPIETLSMGRRDYDPFAEVARMVKDLRDALATAPGGR